MKKICVLFLVLCICSCKKTWDYEGASGPANWGNTEENKFCKIGYSQSPIDIKDKFSEGDLEFFYEKSDVERHKKNHLLQVEFDSRDFLLRGKKKYFVRRFEFHHPSEHLVGGKAHSLEMQIYHKSEDEQWLAVAIFLDVGAENPDFNQVIAALNLKNKDVKVDLSDIVNEKDKLFFYEGSLTVPPCREGVKWYVMETPIEISKEQMKQVIKDGIFAKSNARPVQKFHPEKY